MLVFFLLFVDVAAACCCASFAVVVGYCRLLVYDGVVVALLFVAGAVDRCSWLCVVCCCVFLWLYVVCWLAIVKCCGLQLVRVIVVVVCCVLFVDCRQWY